MADGGAIWNGSDRSMNNCNSIVKIMKIFVPIIPEKWAKTCSWCKNLDSLKDEKSCTTNSDCFGTLYYIGHILRGVMVNIAT